MKTHVLTFSKRFMKGHPREGEPTRFSQKIIQGVRNKELLREPDYRFKVHTIRSNYDWWASKVQEVREQEAYLSLRYWKGKPYKSKQREFLKVHGNDVNKPTTQQIHISSDWRVLIDGAYRAKLRTIAQNDGLTEDDLKEWFGNQLPFGGIIIHFTDYRY